MPADLIVDLRKVLRKVPAWDDLAWDGTTVLAIYKNKIAKAITHRALKRALDGIIPITASRHRRDLVIVSCSREDAIREIATGHLVAANLAIDEVLKTHPVHVLAKLLHDPHLTPPVHQRVKAVLHVKTLCAVDAAERVGVE